jgi:IS30 family transposase
MIKTYGMSTQERDQVWLQWRAGVSLSKIGVSLGRPHQHVLRYLKSYGGVWPEPCKRPKKQLLAAEREEISRGLAAGDSYPAIGNRLGRAHTTISREVTRNGGPSNYRATAADTAAGRGRCRAKRSKLAGNPRLRRQVERWSKDDWSPEQISHRLRLEYPTEAESRDIVGHIEGDLVMGKRPSAVATLVDRKTRQIKILALTGIKARPVKDALADHLDRLPRHARQTLTWDRGREMAQHQELTRQTGCQGYFCDAQSPWQRGSNENANRLLRQYLPRGADLSTFTQRDLDKIADKLNNRPRKTLDWRTPNEAYAEATGALTG